MPERELHFLQVKTPPIVVDFHQDPVRGGPDQYFHFLRLGVLGRVGERFLADMEKGNGVGIGQVFQPFGRTAEFGFQ